MAEETECKSGHRGIDHQEVVDLYLGNETTNNIGWGYRRIANYLECSSHNVRNHIRSENVKREKAGLPPLKEAQKKRGEEKPEESVKKLKEVEASIEGEPLDEKESPEEEPLSREEMEEQMDATDMSAPGTNPDDLPEVDPEAEAFWEEAEKNGNQPDPEMDEEELNEIEFDGEPLEVGTSKEEEYLGPEGKDIHEVEDEVPPARQVFNALKAKFIEIGSETPDKDATLVTDFIISEQHSVSDSLRSEYGRGSRKVRSLIIDALNLDLVKSCSNEDFDEALEAYKEGL